MPKRLEVITEGILFRNPLPGHRAICAFYPSVLPLSEQELLCFYRRGQAMYSLDGGVYQLRSTDGGLTWSDEGCLRGPGRDGDGSYTYTAPCGSVLSGGRIVLLAHRHQAVEQTMVRFNPETGGWRGTEVVMFFSDNAGKSWSNPQLINVDDEGLSCPASNIIELDGENWLLVCERWKAWDDPSPLHIKDFVLFSSDKGQTWGSRVDLPGGSDSQRMYSHGQFRKLSDGRIMGTQWTQSVGGQQDFDLHLVSADPAGKGWSNPQPTGIPGQTSCIGQLPGGALVAVYSRRDRDKPGIVVALSEDGGSSWDLDEQILVWDAVGQEYLGVDHKPSYPASHDNIAFGRPSLAVLPSGEIIVSWWCTQACVTHIRFAKLATC